MAQPSPHPRESVIAAALELLATNPPPTTPSDSPPDCAVAASMADLAALTPQPQLRRTVLTDLMERTGMEGVASAVATLCRTAMSHGVPSVPLPGPAGDERVDAIAGGLLAGYRNLDAQQIAGWLHSVDAGNAVDVLARLADAIVTHTA
jgi:hypothetical protein